MVNRNMMIMSVGSWNLRRKLRNSLRLASSLSTRLKVNGYIGNAEALLRMRVKILRIPVKRLFLELLLVDLLDFFYDVGLFRALVVSNSGYSGEA